MLTQQQLYEAIDETPGIAVNIIRLLSRRIRELNNELNEKQQEVKDLTRQTSLTYTQDAQRSPVSPLPQPAIDEALYSQDDGKGNFPYSSFPY